MTARRRTEFQLRFLLLAGLLALWPQGGQVWAAEPPAIPTVAVGIPPYAHLVQRLAGGFVKVATVMDASRDPHTYEPTPRRIQELGQARLFFAAGLEFERRILGRLGTIAPGMRAVDLGGQAPGHAHLDEHEDDPHIWMSPPKLREQVAIMSRHLADLVPAQAEAIRANEAALRAELDALDAELAQTLRPYRGRVIYVFHPSFGYFCEAYGLRQKAVEQQGKTPSVRQMAELIAQAKADRARIVFAQPQFDRKSAETLAAAIDGAVVPLDALAPDVLDNFRRIAAAVAKALAEQGR